MDTILDDLVVVISFGDEQVGVARERDKRLRPFGVGAIGDDTSLGLDAVREKRPAGFAMHDGKRRDFDRAEAARLLRLERNNRQLKALPGFRRMLE